MSQQPWQQSVAVQWKKWKQERGLMTTMQSFVWKLDLMKKFPMNGNNHNKNNFFHLSKPPSLRPLRYPLCLQRNTTLPSTWNENPSIFPDIQQQQGLDSLFMQKFLGAAEETFVWKFSLNFSFLFSSSPLKKIVYDVVFHRGEKESLEATSNKILKGRRKKNFFLGLKTIFPVFIPCHKILLLFNNGLWCDAMMAELLWDWIEGESEKMGRIHANWKSFTHPLSRFCLSSVSNFPYNFLSSSRLRFADVHSSRFSIETAPLPLNNAPLHPPLSRERFVWIVATTSNLAL